MRIFSVILDKTRGGLATLCPIDGMDKTEIAILDPTEETGETRIAEAVRSPKTIIAARQLKGLPDIERLSSRLAVHEALNNIEDGSVALWAIMGDTPESLRTLSLSWVKPTRLQAIIFSPLRLMAQFVPFPPSEHEKWPEPLRVARAMTAIRAMELAIPAYEWIINTVDPALAISLANRDGFSGVILPTDDHHARVGRVIEKISSTCT
jgi:hypothetical protein